MSAKTNAGFLSGLTNWIKDMNAAEREMNLKDAAINRGPGGGEVDEQGLPKLTVAEKAAGLGGEVGQVDIQERVDTNNVASGVNKTFTDNSKELRGVDRSRKDGEKDIDYYSRMEGTQDSVLAVKGAVDAGVPSTYFDSSTQYTPSQVQQIKKDYDKNQTTIGLIEAETFGPKELAALREANGGKPLNSQQLSQVLQLARSKDPVTVSQLATAKSGREVNSQTIASSKAADELARVTATNNQLVQQAEIDFNNKKLQRDYDISVIQRADKIREAELDRGLRKDLAVLGLEDKRDSRAYERSRDERKDRQLMIMQLMKGLSGLGQNLAI